MEIRLATRSDLLAIGAIVESAYRPYVDRIGRRPAPMDDDYRDKLDRDQAAVAVAVADGDVVGLIVLVVHPDHLFIENVAVDPARQGSGIGRALLTYAEIQARQHGLAELRLYTNAAMTENLALYARLGYCEVERRLDHGFERVFLSRRLA